MLRGLTVAMLLLLVSAPAHAFQDAPPGLSVRAGTGTANVRARTSPHALRFELSNSGPHTEAVVLSCIATGAASACAVSERSLSVGPGESARVYVRYAAARGGSGAVRLLAKGQGPTAEGVYQVAVDSDGQKAGVIEPTIEARALPGPYSGTPDVSPQSGLATVAPGWHEADFYVENVGTSTGEFRLTCSFGGSINNCWEDMLLVSLPPGGVEYVPVGYNLTGPGTGTITLTAAGSSTSSGSYTVTPTTAPAAPIVDVIRRNPGPLMDRSACVITSAGPSSAYQCGELIVTHELPTFRSLNRDRTLTLLYNSGTAKVQPIVVAQVRNMGSLADSLVATLTIANADSTYSFASAPAGGAPVQIAMPFTGNGLPTGVHGYSLTVRSYFGGVPQASTVNGEITVVNRSASVYGAGWAVAGINQIYPNQRNGAVLLVDADGSTAIYESIGNGRYLAPAGAFRDTLVYGAVAPDSQPGWVRRSLNGTATYYNGDGKQSWVVERAGHKTQYLYRGAGSEAGLDTVRIAPWDANLLYALSYDAAGKLNSISDPGGRTTQITVSGGQLTRAAYPGMPWVQFAYTNGLLSSRTSMRGGEAKYIYVANTGLLAEAQLPWNSVWKTTALKPAQAWGLWTGSGTAPVDTGLVQVEVNGPRDDVLDRATFQVNGSGMPLKITDPFNAVTRIVYRAGSPAPALPDTIVLPNGRRLHYAWNANGMLIQLRDSTKHLPNGAATAVVTNEYNSPYTKSAPSRITHATELVDSLTYTPTGLLETVTAPGGHITRYAYTKGKPTIGAIANLLRSITEENVMVYDSAGGEVPASPVTSFQYDARGNLVGQLSPLANADTFDLDSFGRVRNHYDPEGHRTEYVYDVLNRIIESTHHESAAVRYTTRSFYNGEVLDSVLDPRGVARRFEYDGLGRMTAEIDDYGARESHFYNASGLVDSTRTRMNLVIRHTYDAAGRRTATAWPPRPHPNLGVAVNGGSLGNTYDPLTGELRIADNGQHKIVRTYYPNGLLRTEVQSLSNGGAAYTNTYQYDVAGRRTRYVIGADSVIGTRLLYGYNATTGALRSIAARFPGNVQDSVIFQVDSLGRRHRVLYSPASNGIALSFAYDDDGRMRRLCSTHGGGMTGDVFLIRMEKRLMNRDGFPQQLTTVSGNGCVSNLEEGNSFTYDTRHQMLTDSRYEYRYDGSGNLIRKKTISNGITDTMAVAAGHNRLIRKGLATSGHKRYEYFADGARRDELSYVGSDTVAWFGDRYYFYDALGRNTGYVYYDQSGYPIYASDICVYDPIGRLRSGCDPDAVAALGYDGDNVVRTAPDGVLGWTFVHGPGTDDPVMGYHPNAGLVYWVTDGAGRQYAVARMDGIDYSGESLYALGGKFAGGISNAHTFGADRYQSPNLPGLSFFRNRFYDQNTGRWTQEDPLGIAAGTNMYAYVGNNPATFTDPFGLCKDDDDVCKGLVSRLGEIGGETLELTAKTLGDYQGRVILRTDWAAGTGSASANFLQIGTGVSNTSMGPVRGGEGDILLTAVHEAGHLRGIGNEYGSSPAAMSNFDRLLNLERSAFNELGPVNYTAPVHYLRLNDYNKTVNFYRPPPPIR